MVFFWLGFSSFCSALLCARFGLVPSLVRLPWDLTGFFFHQPAVGSFIEIIIIRFQPEQPLNDAALIFFHRFLFRWSTGLNGRSPFFHFFPIFVSFQLVPRAVSTQKKTKQNKIMRKKTFISGGVALFVVISFKTLKRKERWKWLAVSFCAASALFDVSYSFTVGRRLFNKRLFSFSIHFDYG